MFVLIHRRHVHHGALNFKLLSNFNYITSTQGLGSVSDKYATVMLGDDFMGTGLFRIITILSALGMISVYASGCGNKNVDHLYFNKTGYSNLAGSLKADTSAQGGSSDGASALPGTANNVMSRTSVGGTYQRSTSQSAHYRVIGGFHVTQSQ